MKPTDEPDVVFLCPLALAVAHGDDASGHVELGHADVG